MGLVGSYSAILYCDSGHARHFLGEGEGGVVSLSLTQGVGEYDGRTLGDCVAQARANGWLVNLRHGSAGETGWGRALCPRCSGKRGKGDA